MLLALEFYVRCLDLRHNLPVPCSFCLENTQGDRKVVTLNDAYRKPNLVAVRHWHLSDCLNEQALPSLSEKLVPQEELFQSDFVVVPDHRIMGYHSPPVISSLNLLSRPMKADQFLPLYESLFKPDVHLFYKETWVWREFLRVYLPFMSSYLSEFENEVQKLRELMAVVMTGQPDLWHKWLHWRKYMIDFQGIPGEVAFCREYGSSYFIFS